MQEKNEFTLTEEQLVYLTDTEKKEYHHYMQKFEEYKNFKVKSETAVEEQFEICRMLRYLKNIPEKRIREISNDLHQSVKGILKAAVMSGIDSVANWKVINDKDYIQAVEIEYNGKKFKLIAQEM